MVVARRSDAPWAMAFRLYLWLGALIVLIREFFRFVFGGGEGSTILLRLPAAEVLGDSPAFAPQVAKILGAGWLTVADVRAALPGGVR